jgi:hypothetical protein
MCHFEPFPSERTTAFNSETQQGSSSNLFRARQHLHPLIRGPLVLYRPAISPIRSLLPSTTLQLNLFAGQLYLRTFEDYEFFCASLGLCPSPPAIGLQVTGDGFVGSISAFTLVRYRP